MDRQLLAQWAESQGLALSANQLEQFAMYERLLQDWSDRMNLTTIRDPLQVTIRHFIDSLSCALVTGDLNKQRLVDVGTGAGFPGLPLKILYPRLTLTLADSVAKKTVFLHETVDALGLADVTILAARAEELGQNSDHRERYDWAVARSVAELRTLVEYLLPLVRVGGHALAMKGERYEDEVTGATNAIRQLGGETADIRLIRLPHVDQTHALIALDKVASTDERFPRRVGVPAKRPL